MRRPEWIIPISAILLSSVYQTGDSFCYAQTIKNDTLPTLKVTARKSKKDLTSTTPVHTIDAEKIRTSAITDISDALRRMPGVNLRDYGGAGGLKTVSVRGLGAEHTAVIYDGIPLSDIQNGAIDLSRYSLDNMGSLSLTSGDTDDIFLPAKAAASSASLFMSSFTNPDLANSRLHGKAQFRIGAFGSYNPFFRIEKSNGENLGFTGIAEYIHAKNNYPFTLRNGNNVTRERRNNSMMNSWHGELNGIWKPASGSTLSAKLYYYDNSRQLPGPVTYYVSKNHEHLHDRNFFGQLRFKGRIADRLSLLANAKFNWASTRYTDISESYTGGKLDQRYLQNETYASAALLYNPIDGLSIDYSADWIYNYLNSNLPTDIRPYRNSILQSVAAKYRFSHFTVMARGLLSIYLNNAREGEAQKDFTRFSPSVSLSYQPVTDRNLFIRVSYKNIFRLPTFNEAYFDHRGSINLNPETTDQINLGASWNWHSEVWLRNVSMTADCFINLVKNKIMAVPFNMFIWTMTNLGHVRIFGAEITLNTELAIAPGHSILVDGTYTYQRAQNRSERGALDWMKQLAYTPLNSGSLSLTWRNPWVNVVAHAVGSSARFSTRENIAETRISGYIDAGFALYRDFHIGMHTISFRADLINAFNRQYEIVRRYPMPGRSWQATIGYSF